MHFKTIFPGVFSIDGKLATLNLAKGRRVYGEELVEVERKEYRLWNPYRSKLAAAVLNGLKSFEIGQGSNVLYLGAATGTTSSHVSDIVGKDGSVYAVELSERNARELIKVCEERKNMLPILADATTTDGYEKMVEQCDIIYQDISAKRQADILLANAKLLKKGGIAYFIIKSQSIDIAKSPKKVFEEELGKLKSFFDVIERVNIEPYDQLHMFAVLRKL